MTAIELVDSKFHFSPTGMTVSHNPTFEEWQQCGEQLKYIESAIHWWIGDWLNYGEARWGEMYSQAINETDYTKSTLQNIKYVAGKVDSSRRREDLSFSHHSEVAALPADEQDKWLDVAEQESLSTRQLRQEIKAQAEPDYGFLIRSIIHSIERLRAVYPDGVEAIRKYLEAL